MLSGVGEKSDKREKAEENANQRKREIESGKKQTKRTKVRVGKYVCTIDRQIMSLNMDW